MADKKSEGEAKAPAPKVEAQAAPANPATSGGTGTLIDDIIAAGRMARTESQKPHARDLIGEFATQVLDQGMDIRHDLVATISERIARMDEILSDQLNQILHHEKFQKLEATWRGLHGLVTEHAAPDIKIRVLNATKKEIRDDGEKATEFDQSALFKKVYEHEYGTFGGHPYGLLIGDYEFGRSGPDISLLSKVSNVAAAAHAPFIASTSPQMFDMEGFTELGVPRDLSKVLASSEMAAWRGFRKSEDSRYVGLTLPRTLMRLPYDAEANPIEEFNFIEDVDGTDHSKYLWGSAAWSLGGRILESFAKHQWCASIRGVEGGGLVKGLPVHTATTPAGDKVATPPTEIAITDRREKELADLGFIPLCYSKGSDFAAFFATQSAHEPVQYDTPEATANAELSAQLQYVLTASRFAHYLKVMMRDKIGSFASVEDVSDYLNRWIVQYVLLNDSSSQTVKSRYPLREARVDVTADPAKPGAYSAVVFIRPHFQLNELSASVRLVTELPSAAAA